MGQQELQDHLADSVYLLGAGSYDQILLHRVDAGDNESCRAAALYFHDAEPAAPEGFQFLVVAEGGYRYACTFGCLQNGHPCLRFDFFSVNLQKDFTHFCLLSLTIVLASSGIGGGTGSPEIFVTARNLGGQTSKQVPHLVHFSWSTIWIRFLPPSIASDGHFLRAGRAGLALGRIDVVGDQLFTG